MPYLRARQRRPALGAALALVLGCSVPPSPAASVVPTPSPVVILRAPGADPIPGVPAGPPPLGDRRDEGAPSPASPAPDDAVTEEFSKPDETAALAAAPPVDAAAPAVAEKPTAVTLPPSARLVIASVPTPNVVASSPVLAGAGPSSGTLDYQRALKLVQDSRKAAGAERLEERINAAIARARGTGSEVEVLGWQAGLKGSADVYQVTFTLRENRQGMRAEWEVNVASGEVRSTNPLAQALDGASD
jgi:hypothetical protein